MNNFEKLGLSQQLVNVLNGLNITQPTPIQEKAIPMLLAKESTDFIGLAQTGTGKTAAFGLPLIDRIDASDKSTQAVVLSPTRELSQQTAAQLISFAKAKPGIHIVSVFGGAAISNQIKALRKGAQIVVATPGRLIDLLGRNAVDLTGVKYVILDEADEMLNMGFKESIDEILETTNEFKNTWLFSATMPSSIQRIASTYMNKPQKVSVITKQKSNKDILHQFVVTKTDHKLAAIRRFLDLQPDMKGVLFCRTKRETQKIADELSKLGYGAEALHGDMSQAQRDSAMKKFKDRSLQMLVATDVAARGIDVQELTHVMHHTLPDQLENYTHRSGRTGRAGNKGISLAFINGRERGKIRKLQDDLKVTFEEVQVPSMAELKMHRIQHWANYIINTKTDEQSEEILNEVRTAFEGLTKDDILKRLITTQLDHLFTHEDVDFSVEKVKSDKGKSTTTYFINIGTMDGLTKGDVVHFLKDFGDVEKEVVGDISMHKSYALVELPKSFGTAFIRKFEGLELDGRAIRVSVHEEKEKSQSNRKGSFGKKSGKRVPRRDRDRRRKRSR